MIIVALLGILWTPAHLRAQQAPSAVIADGPTDKKFPPGLAQFIVPSHGAELDAWLYVASGPGPHGTVILPHGLPGYEMRLGTVRPASGVERYALPLSRDLGRARILLPIICH